MYRSSKPPVDASEVIKSTTEFYVGRIKLCQWISFVLDEGFVQFGGHMYSHLEYSWVLHPHPTWPVISNEFKFLKVMIDEYVHAINSGSEPLYPYAFILQYRTSTKRFIDDILTVSLGPQTEGPTFEQIIKQQGNIYGEMYPSFIDDADGEEIENPISTVKEQSGETVHFLDMEIVQHKPGVSNQNV